MAKKSNTEQNQAPKLNPFEQAIKAYLDGRAAEDPQFAQSYAKEKKSIKECCDFIIGEASKKRNGNAAVMTDEEVYGLAVHYYDEDDIKVNRNHGGAGVRPPHNGATYEPTEEDKENAKKAALKRLEDEAFQKLHAPKKKKTEEAEQPTNAGTQTSLFDLL